MIHWKIKALLESMLDSSKKTSTFCSQKHKTWIFPLTAPLDSQPKQHSKKRNSQQKIHNIKIKTAWGSRIPQHFLFSSNPSSQLEGLRALAPHPTLTPCFLILLTSFISYVALVTKMTPRSGFFFRLFSSWVSALSHSLSCS